MPRVKFRSKNEREAYATLRGLFPNTPILHDYHVGGGLKVDFLIKSPTRIGVEIDGAQHYGFNSRWHKDRGDYEEQKRRDARKEQLCVEQGIVLVRHNASKGVDSTALRRQVMTALKSSSSVPKKPKESTSKVRTDFELKMLQNQRKQRKAAYRRWKKRMKENR